MIKLGKHAGRWSRKYEQCIMCDKTEFPHKQYGACKKCVSTHPRTKQAKKESRKRQKKGIKILNKYKWGKFEKCVICGKTEFPHKQYGGCLKCFNKTPQANANKKKWKIVHPKQYKLSEKRRRSTLKYKQRIAISDKIRYKINKANGKALQWNKNWCKNNWDKLKIIQQRRRTLRAGQEVDYKYSDMKYMLSYFNNKCVKCSVRLKSDNFSFDHFIPLSRGGGFTYDNIIPLCISCNSGKKAKMAEIFFGKMKYEKVLIYFEKIKKERANINVEEWKRKIGNKRQDMELRLTKEYLSTQNKRL